MQGKNQLNLQNGHEWTFDASCFQVIVSLNNQQFWVKATNLDAGEQYGPTRIFQGIKSSMAIDYLSNLPKRIDLGEVTDASIKIHLDFYEDPIELPVQQHTSLEKECTLLKLEVKKLQEQLKAQEKESDELRTEIKSLKEQVGKTFYLNTSVDDWKQYGDGGIVVHVDISHLKLTQKPHVQASLQGGSSHWSTTGSNSIYNLTPNSFSIYVKWAAGGALTVAQAKGWSWYISYMVTSLD